MRLKEIILVLISILLLPTILALYGGDSKILYSFEDCVYLVTEVRAEEKIDAGEYSIRNCTEIEENLWFCICDGSFDVTVDTLVNTVNKYYFTIDYAYKIESNEELENLNETERIININNSTYITRHFQNISYTTNKPFSHIYLTIKIALFSFFGITILGITILFFKYDKKKKK